MSLSLCTVSRSRFTVFLRVRTGLLQLQLVNAHRGQTAVPHQSSREERCLAAVLYATRAYHDLASLPPSTREHQHFAFPFPHLSLCSRNSRRHPSTSHLQSYPALTSNPSHHAPFQLCPSRTNTYPTASTHYIHSTRNTPQPRSSSSRTTPHIADAPSPPRYSDHAREVLRTAANAGRVSNPSTSVPAPERPPRVRSPCRQARSTTPVPAPAETREFLKKHS